MIDSPNIIIIGSTGRNVGKTEFCCELIRRQIPDRSVFGIKITASNESGSVQLTEETNPLSGKDTARMLKAGAKQVFWLRTPRKQLQEELQGLLPRLPEKSCVVCESTSARSVINPGLFFIIRAANSDEVKPSCEPLIESANRVVTSYGDHWDIDPKSVTFRNGRWEIR